MKPAAQLPEVRAADSQCFRSAETMEGGEEGATSEIKKERGMICGHWAKESHMSIHLCQGRGRRKDEMEECGEPS